MLDLKENELVQYIIQTKETIGPFTSLLLLFYFPLVQYIYNVNMSNFYFIVFTLFMDECYKFYTESHESTLFAVQQLQFRLNSSHLIITRLSSLTPF